MQFTITLIDKAGTACQQPAAPKKLLNYEPQDCFTLPQHRYALALQYASQELFKDSSKPNFTSEFDTASRSMIRYLEDSRHESYLFFTRWDPKSIKQPHFFKMQGHAGQHIKKILGDVPPDIFLDKRIFSGRNYPFVNRCMDPFCSFGLLNQEALITFDEKIKQDILLTTQTQPTLNYLSFASGYLGRDWGRLKSMPFKTTTTLNLYFVDLIYKDYIENREVAPIKSQKEWINYQLIKKMLEEFVDRLHDLFTTQNPTSTFSPINLFFAASADSFMKYAKKENLKLDIMIGEDYWIAGKANRFAGYNTDTAYTEVRTLLPLLAHNAFFYELTKNEEDISKKSYQYVKINHLNSESESIPFAPLKDPLA